jgi:hypothetical protein
LFEDQTFRVEPYSGTETFVSSTENAIIHGSIKRLMPRTEGEVALTFDSGKLVIYMNVRKKALLFVIMNPNHSFNGFFCK